MNTTGGGVVEVLLYTVVVAAAWQLARSRSQIPLDLRLRPGPVALWIGIAVPSLLALVVPSLLHDLRRSPGSITFDDQWWRVVTSVLVQDRGFVGTLLNLVVLAVVLVLADAVWGSARMFAVFGACHVLFALLATYMFPSSGAGSSGATIALASSVGGVVAVLDPKWRESILAGVMVVAGIALLALQDIHGVAILVGTVVGAVTGVVWPPQRTLASVP